MHIFAKDCMSIIKLLIFSVILVNSCYSAQALQFSEYQPLDKVQHSFDQAQDRHKKEVAQKLYDAIDFGRIQEVQEILKDTSIDINSRLYIIIASSHNYTDIVKLLLNYPNINVNIQDNFGDTPLIWAIDNPQKDIVKLLLNQPDVDVNIKNSVGDTALIKASFYKNVELAELLLNHPYVNVNIQCRRGRTALIRAATNGCTQIVKLLLDHPAINVSLETDDRKSAVVIAKECGYNEIVELLETYINEYLPYKNKRIEELNKMRHANICAATAIAPEVANIINQYAGHDFVKKDLLTFSQFLMKK